jgi:hypothetical protein
MPTPSTDNRLHEIDLGTNRVQIMMHRGLDGGVSVLLDVRDGDETASINLSPAQARAAAAVLVVAAEQAEVRIAKQRGVAA